MYKYFKPITNLEYRKMPQGPLPSNFDSILKSMEEEDIIKSYKIDKLGGYIQHSFFCLKEPNLDDFTSQEINVLDKVIVQTYKKTAKQLSNQTHDELWESIRLGKVMPLESVFLQDVIPATKCPLQYDTRKFHEKTTFIHFHTETRGGACRNYHRSSLNNDTPTA